MPVETRTYTLNEGAVIYIYHIVQSCIEILLSKYNNSRLFFSPFTLRPEM